MIVPIYAKVSKHKRPKLVGKHEGLLIGGLFFSFKGKK
jgi:hypothetical protein